MKWLKGSLALIVLLASQMVGVSSAHAVSAYDDIYQTVDTIRVNRPSTGRSECVDRDLTYGWSEYILNADLWSSVYDNTTVANATIKNSFEEALANGSWGVSQVNYGTGDTADAAVLVYWSEDSQFDMTWYSSGYLYANPTHSVYIDCDLSGIHMQPDEYWFTTNTYNHISRRPYATGTGMMYPALNFFANTSNISYPSNYEGQLVRQAYTPPPPVLYSGTVDCGVDTITYMQITQDGSTHDVQLTYESAYRASWSDWLTSTPYTITVGCGLGVAASFGSVTPMPPTSNDWICDTTKNPRYCVLS